MQRSAGYSPSCLIHGVGIRRIRGFRTVVIVLEQERPIARVEGRRHSLRLDGEIILGADFGDRHFVMGRYNNTTSAQYRSRGTAMGSSVVRSETRFDCVKATFESSAVSRKAAKIFGPRFLHEPQAFCGGH
jgi:hypothetical protein